MSRTARVAALCLCWLPMGAEVKVCEPSPEVRAELDKAAAIPVDENQPFEQKIAPFQRLKEANPRDLFVHMFYQDAVEAHGVKGSIDDMVGEYRRLSTNSPDAVFELYLFARALEGVTTPQSISLLTQVLEKDPQYAPAHRSLAEIYGSKAFRDPEKEQIERAKFLSLCPGSKIAVRPYPLPPMSPLLNDAAALLKQGRDLERIPGLIEQAMSRNNWRVQVQGPYDWYSIEEKKEAVREVREAYWTGWGILAEVYLLTDQAEKAQEQLLTMEQRFARLPKDQIATAWKAGTMLADLFARTKQPLKVREVLERMEGFLAQQSDKARRDELEKLRRKYDGLE